MSKREQYLHGTVWQNKAKTENAVICTIKDIDSGQSRLEIIKNPNRQIAVTKKYLRTNENTKKICEQDEALEIRTIRSVDILYETAKLLYGKEPRGYINKTSIYKSPYVYGIDINIDVLIKQHLYKSAKTLATKYSVGALDIETDIVGTTTYSSNTKNETIIIINYTAPNLHTYSAVLRKFVDGIDEQIILDNINASLQELANGVTKKTKEKITNELGVTLKFFDSELELIKWTFKNIHDTRPEYVGIWSMDFDIPHILQRIRDLGGNPWDIICHPDVPRKYRICRYRQDDNPNLSHFTHAWSYFELTSPTQYYDAMCLYSRLRKFDGVEDSYALDYIAKKSIGWGKQELEAGGHYEMQTTRKAEYCGYAARDTLLIVLMELVNEDIVSMNYLIPYSDFASFAQQTVQLKNRFYAYCRENKVWPGSMLGKIEHETDAMIDNEGGNVLKPNYAWSTAVNKVKELVGFCRNIGSKMFGLANDSDVTSEYPSLAEAGNISKDTKVLTVLNISGFSRNDIIDLMSNIMYDKENAVYLSHKFLNLPNYSEMYSIYNTTTFIHNLDSQESSPKTKPKPAFWWMNKEK